MEIQVSFQVLKMFDKERKTAPRYLSFADLPFITTNFRDKAPVFNFVGVERVAE